jgi:maltose O-acetyltransferase
MSERVEPKYQPAWQRFLVALQTEVVGVHPRLHAYNLIASVLPPRGAGALRAKLFGLSGVRVGPGTKLHGPFKVTGPGNWLDNLSIGADCNVGAHCMLDLSDRLTIGDRVTIDPGVMILTSTHELDFPQHRAGKILLNPVSVGDGAWLRARSVILPGVKIGAGAVVEAGAVVNRDVEPNTRVGGIPASKLEAMGSST